MPVTVMALRLTGQKEAFSSSRLEESTPGLAAVKKTL